jgi:hypothetical protein
MRINTEKLSAWGDRMAEVLLYGFALFGLLTLCRIVLEHLLF